MAPTAVDYVYGLRRLWWLPLSGLIIALLLGAAMATRANSTTSTSGFVLFTFRAEAPGQDSDGSARQAESSTAQARLASYSELATIGERVTSLLASAGVSKGAVDVTTDQESPGLVSIRLENGDLAEPEAILLWEKLSQAVVQEVLAVDDRQEAPSLTAEVVEAQPSVQTGTTGMAPRIAVLVLAGLGLGLGAVYLIVWQQGRINTRRDIEERLGARVLADITGSPADGAALALALARGRQGTTTAVLTPTGGPGQSSSKVAEAVAASAPRLGLQLDLRGPGPAPAEPQSADLVLIDAADHGLDAECLRSVADADVVAVVVDYGRTSYRDLDTAGRILAEVTEAEVAVVGVRQRQRGSAAKKH